jgi:hypothetical protein
MIGERVAGALVIGTTPSRSRVQMRLTVAAINVSCCHMILVILRSGVSWRRSRRRASTSASTPDPADRSGGPASTVCAAPMRHQRRESRQDRSAEVAIYPDRVPGGCWASRCASTTAKQPMTGAVPSRRCRAIENMQHRAEGSGRVAFRRQITAQALCISPELAVRHGEARAWPGIPAPAWAASIQPVTWLGIGREELVSQARTGAGVRQARCVAVRDGPARWARGRGATTT